MTTTNLGKVVITPRGAYSAGTAYVALDAITYSGSSYLVLQDVTGVTPSDDGVNYQLLAAKGDQGEQGDAGATGPTGRTPSVQSVVSAATVTPTFADDLVKITAQAEDLALTNPTGTAIPGLGVVIRIKDNGTARAITYGAQYRAIGVDLPASTVAGKTTYMAMIYNADDTKWDVVAIGIEE